MQTQDQNTDIHIPGTLSAETLDKMRALYLDDLDHGQTRAIQYRAADKLLSLARFELAQARAAEKARAQAEKDLQPAGPTVEEAAEVLANTRVLSVDAPFVHQYKRDYRIIPSLGALTASNHKRLLDAGLLIKDGRQAHPSLLIAFAKQQQALVST